MPFDVEVFANSIRDKKSATKKCRGPDSPLYSVLYPAVCIIKLFGLGPYTFSKDQLVPSNIPLIFTCFFIMVYSSGIYFVSTRLTLLRTTSPLLGWTETAKTIFNSSVALYELLFAFFTRKTFVKVWNGIQDYDDTVRQLGYQRTERTTGIVVRTCIILQAGVWFIVGQANVFAFTADWIFNFGYVCIYMGTSVCLYKFVGMCLLLAQRFKHLTELAIKNLPPHSGRMNPGNVSRRTIQNLHDELMVLGETLDSLYRWSLFFYLGNLSVHSVSNLYFIISYLLMDTWDGTQLPAILCLGSYLSAFIIQLLVLHLACDYTSKKANSIHVVLLDWNLRLIRRFPKTEVFESSVHMLNRKLHFSAAGCFDVDLPLLRSIAAALSTYLVILLQLPN